MKSTLQEKNKTNEEDIVIIKNSTFTDTGENKPSGNVVKTLATFVTFSMISVSGNCSFCSNRTTIKSFNRMSGLQKH